MFYMNYGVFNEGEQAHAYLKKKADDAHNKEMQDLSRTMERSQRKMEDLQSLGKRDVNKLRKSMSKYEKDLDSRYDNIKDNDYKSQIASAHAGMAALKRAEKDSGVKVQDKHLKKMNTKHECGIFSETCFIN